MDDRSLTPWYGGNESLFFRVICHDDLWVQFRSHMYIINGVKKRSSRWHDYEDAETAAYYGYLSLIKAWFHGLVKRESAPHYAAEQGHLRVVKYFHKRGYLCEPGTLISAATNGHLDVVKFLHNNGISRRSYDAWYAAIMKGHYEINRFMCSRDYAWQHIDYMLVCAQQYKHERIIGFLEVVIFASQRPFLVQDAVICD